ncbi:hypothetical protein GBAR_LOCUS24719 [Geodia barretti]|uniref:Uncharacterized protein n=1 Tax=Geodia barretti TaxID=519541 RepID=A0AA35TA97_GEOBA|nr:hypothetical protein GBAR_LOCUS24719 [Geodia barretti]
MCILLFYSYYLPLSLSILLSPPPLSLLSFVLSFTLFPSISFSVMLYTLSLFVQATIFCSSHGTPSPTPLLLLPPMSFPSRPTPPATDWGCTNQLSSHPAEWRERTTPRVPLATSEDRGTPLATILTSSARGVDSCRHGDTRTPPTHPASSSEVFRGI